MGTVYGYDQNPQRATKRSRFVNNEDKEPFTMRLNSTPAEDRARSKASRQRSEDYRARRDTALAVRGLPPAEAAAVGAAGTQSMANRTALATTAAEESGKMARDRFGKEFDAGTMTAAESGRQGLAGNQQEIGKSQFDRKFGLKSKEQEDAQALAEKTHNLAVDEADMVTYEEWDPATNMMVTKTRSKSLEGFTLIDKYSALSEEERSPFLKGLSSEQRQGMQAAYQNIKSKYQTDQPKVGTNFGGGSSPASMGGTNFFQIEAGVNTPGATVGQVITAEEWFIKENLPMLLFLAEEDDDNFAEKTILEKRDIVRELGKVEFAKQKLALIPVEPIEK